MSSPQQFFDTQLYQVSISNEFKSNLLNSSTFTPRSTPPNSLDYTSANAIQAVFESLPLPSEEFYQAIEPSLRQAAQLLATNQAVAFPTETVYGLGANACDTDAVMKIYQAKGRPSDNPLIVHISTLQQLTNLTPSPINPLALALIHHFWPGPLSIILPHNNSVSSKVTAGLNTLAIRMPNHPIALALIKQSNCPIAAPSSNTSGKPSPTLAEHVINDLAGKIPAVVDGFIKLTSKQTTASSENNTTETPFHEIIDLNCNFGLESTVVDISHIPPDFDFSLILPPFRSSTLQPSQQSPLQPSDHVKQPLIYILRPGAITKSMLEAIVGQGYVEYDPTLLINIDSFDALEESSLSPAPFSSSSSSTTTTTNLLQITSQLPNGVKMDPIHTQVDTKHHSLTPKSPGMKYIHYAPKAPVYIARKLDTLIANLASSLQNLPSQFPSSAQPLPGSIKLGLLCTTESYTFILQELERLKTQDGLQIDLSNILVKTCGSKENMYTIATNLYRCLREFDQEEHVCLIYAELLAHNDLGAAIMDRLLKAAGGKFLR